MPEWGRLARWGPYALMIALAAIEPMTHCWIVAAPPAKSVPTGLHTGDSGHHLVAMASFSNGFASPFATCRAEDGGSGFRYFAAPIFLLYGIVGEIGRLLGISPFLWLGLVNGLGGFLLFWSVYRFLRHIAPNEAMPAFYLYALGGGLGGLVFLGAGLGGELDASGFEAWFHRFARYELIEGQHLSPILLMPRFYYTLPLALGFAALTALVETDRGRCPAHLVFTCFLLFTTTAINLRLGPLLWGVGAAYLLLGSPNERLYRLWLAVSTCGAVAAGAVVFLGLLQVHPSYADNVRGVTRECILLLPLLFATIWHWPAVKTALCRTLAVLPPLPRAIVVGLSGYLALYALLYLGHQAWYGNWWRGGDLQAAIWASDGAWVAIVPAAVVGWKWAPRRPVDTVVSPGMRWVSLWFVVLLALSVSAWGQGWFLQVSPQRGMVLLGVPLALLAASGLRTWPRPARMAGFALIIGSGVLSQAVAALYFQGHLGRTPGKGHFAYLHYAHMSEADARLLEALPSGTVAVPPWSPIAFGEIVAHHGDYTVLGGPGAMNLGDQPFGALQEDVNRFFDADTDDAMRRLFVEEWCVDYIYCPDTCPVEERVLQAFRDIAWLDPVANAGRGMVFKVRKN